MHVPVHAGIDRLIKSYKAVICDIWGVVHNGVAPYPGLLGCLARIRAAGLPVLLLSNAPRPSPYIQEFLGDIGVTEAYYDHIVTSGDVTVAAINRRADAWHAGLGRKVFHLGPDRGRVLLDHLDCEEAPFETADFIVNTGLVDDETETLEDYRDMLAGALTRKLPMVCANPDVVVMRGERMITCAGALARAYADIGGDVFQHGKPHASAFDMAFERLGGISRGHIVMVGDGLETDIKGAARAGIDSVWIAGGIHAEEVGYTPGGKLDEAKVRAACEAAGARPVAAMTALVWSGDEA